MNWYFFADLDSVSASVLCLITNTSTFLNLLLNYNTVISWQLANLIVNKLWLVTTYWKFLSKSLQQIRSKLKLKNE